MPGLEDVNKLDDLNLQDNVSPDEIQKLKDFENTLKSLFDGVEMDSEEDKELTEAIA